MTRSMRAGCAAAAILLSGCLHTATFITGYRPDVAAAPRSVAGGLAVRPLEDRRPRKKVGSSLDLYKAWVPLLPYITSDIERLDEAARDQSDEMRLTGDNRHPHLGPMPSAPAHADYSYPRSMARAIADDLRTSGLFERVEYLETDAAIGDHRYELTGALRETPLLRRFSSYGLGAAGVFLWLLPVPVEKVTARVSIDLTLVDVPERRTVWAHSLTAQVSRIVTAYADSVTYGTSNDLGLQVPEVGADRGVDQRSLFAWHFAALRTGMVEAKSDLAASPLGR